MVLDPEGKLNGWSCWHKVTGVSWPHCDIKAC